MQVVTIQPKNKSEWKSLRALDITSTEISAIFGVSPWLTKFELHHNKAKQVIVDIEENERMTWGNRLQDAIAEGLAKDNGWKIRPMTEYVRAPEKRLGASFDFEITNLNGILETKNVDSLQFKEGWVAGDDGEIEAPPHIELQIQQQLLLTKKDVGFIGVLIGGNRVCLLERKPDLEIHAMILEAVAKFWEGIANNQPPPADFVRDADFISSLYQGVSEGKVIEASPDSDVSQLMEKYRDVSARIKLLEADKKSYKSQILTLVNDAQKVLGPWGSLSLGLIKETVVPSHVRKGYRDFRPSFRKQSVE